MRNLYAAAARLVGMLLTLTKRFWKYVLLIPFFFQFMWWLAPYTSFLASQTRTTICRALFSSSVSSSILSPSIGYPLRGRAKSPFAYLGHVIHSAAQGPGTVPGWCMRGTLYSWPVFVIGLLPGYFFAADEQNSSDHSDLKEGATVKLSWKSADTRALDFKG